MDKRIILLDMDGVIADFTAGICRAFGVDFDPNNYPLPRGLWDYCDFLKSAWNIKWERVEQVCSDPDFWEELPLLPGADDLYWLLTQGYGFNVYFLTTPTGDYNANLHGKRAWLRKHGYMATDDNRMVLMKPGESKGKLATRGSVLMDDRDKNIQELIKAGGHGVLVPRPWNNRHFDFESYSLANRKAVGNVLEIQRWVE